MRLVMAKRWCHFQCLYMGSSHCKDITSAIYTPVETSLKTSWWRQKHAKVCKWLFNENKHKQKVQRKAPIISQWPSLHNPILYCHVAFNKRSDVYVITLQGPLWPPMAWHTAAHMYPDDTLQQDYDWGTRNNSRQMGMEKPHASGCTWSDPKFLVKAIPNWSWAWWARPPALFDASSVLFKQKLPPWSIRKSQKNAQIN